MVRAGRMRVQIPPPRHFCATTVSMHGHRGLRFLCASCNAAQRISTATLPSAVNPITAGEQRRRMFLACISGLCRCRMVRR